MSKYEVFNSTTILMRLKLVVYPASVDSSPKKCIQRAQHVFVLNELLILQSKRRIKILADDFLPLNVRFDNSFVLDR